MKLDITDSVWQIGSGNDSRDYSKVFLDFGVALVGPGDPGDERLSETALYYQKNPNITNWGKVLTQLQEGQWLILRRGRKIIKAVGRVISDYNYQEIFSDVDGWDLQHFIEVDWYIPDNPNKQIELDKNVLSMSTLEGCYQREVLENIKQYNFIKNQPKYDFKNLALPKEININHISKALIDNGIRIQDADNIASTIQRIIRLAKWYYDNDYYVLEHELRTFLVIPLLISLGWSEQKIKIEYNKIDIAIFNAPFTGDYKLSPNIIIETKRFDHGLFTVQAHEYAKRYTDCNLLIITNGFRYKVLEKKAAEFVEFAYLNLFNLRDRHYLYQDTIKGATAALLRMSHFS